jgi:hypothetical protein
MVMIDTGLRILGALARRRRIPETASGVLDRHGDHSCRPPWTSAGAIAACFLAASCTTIGHSDLLPVADHRLDPAALTELGRGRPAIQVVPVAVGSRTIIAYDARLEHARGVLIAFADSSDSVQSLLQILLPQMRPLNFDLVVFSYYVEGEAPPGVAEIRASARAVYDAVAHSGTPEAQHVYLLGHGVGSWFALDLADSAPVEGLILASVGTSAAETFSGAGNALDSVIPRRPDPDLAPLDGEALAHGVHAPILILTSTADEVIDPKLTQRVYDAVPAATRKRLLVLYGVDHGGYFTRDTVWGAVGDFFRPEFGRLAD